MIKILNIKTWLGKDIDLDDYDYIDQQRIIMFYSQHKDYVLLRIGQ